MAVKSLARDCSSAKKLWTASFFVFFIMFIIIFGHIGLRSFVINNSLCHWFTVEIVDGAHTATG